MRRRCRRNNRNRGNETVIRIRTVGLHPRNRRQGMLRTPGSATSGNSGNINRNPVHAKRKYCRNFADEKRTTRDGTPPHRPSEPIKPRIHETRIPGVIPAHDDGRRPHGRRRLQVRQRQNRGVATARRGGAKSLFHPCDHARGPGAALSSARPRGGGQGRRKALNGGAGRSQLPPAGPDRRPGAQAGRHHRRM